MTDLEKGLIVLVVIMLVALYLHRQQMVVQDQRLQNLEQERNALTGTISVLSEKAQHSEVPEAQNVSAPTQAAEQPGLDSFRPVGSKYEQIAESMMREQTEYYSTGGDSQQDDATSGQQTFSYAKDPYGSPGATYSDFVTSQGVDDQVIRNHMAFVEERKGLGPEGQFTGRTYSPDSHDSYDPIQWQGIRGRHRAVPQINPTQVPDIDTNLYKSNRAFVIWN